MQRCFASPRGPLVLAVLVGLLIAGLVILAGPPASQGDLSSQRKALQQAISADSGRIQAYDGRLADLRERLAGLESSMVVQRALLVRLQGELAEARYRLTELRADLARDRKQLAAQLVAQYESPTPTLVNVLLESHGFTDLLNRVAALHKIADQDARVVRRVAQVKAQVTAQTAHLTVDQARQRRVLSAILIERDQVASIQLAVLERERAATRDRARKTSQLRRVQRRLAALAAAAQRASFSVSGRGSGGYTGGGFASHGGEWGFFPAPGTNYAVGQEPQLAARLDSLGKALHLHLIGLSGYRTPQHSVEVGGFADDPHTRGDASDTPGVEGVPESTLSRFGLTRPFPGAAEADHIQLS
jgi:hypothetical protein